MSLSSSFTVVANFSLPDRSGRTVSLGDYKHRQPGVLVFAATNDEPRRREVARHYQAYAEAGAVVLTRLPARPDRDDWPFAAPLDPEGQYTARQVEHLPAVWVLDSFNERSARFENVTAEELPRERILNARIEVELKRPECGVPEWPQRATR